MPSTIGPLSRVGGAAIPIFIGQQQDLNGSAAALSLLMALVATGEAHRDDLSRLAGLRPDAKYRRVWPWIKRDYLVGADTRELRHLIRKLTSRYGATFTDAKNARAAKWILRQLQQDRWVVIGLEGGQSTLDQWCLVVAFENPETLRRLFLLDPTLPMPVTVCWNARYDLPNNGPGMVFELRRRTYRARLSGAVAMFPLKPNRGTSVQEREAVYV